MVQTAFLQKFEELAATDRGNKAKISWRIFRNCLVSWNVLMYEDTTVEPTDYLIGDILVVYGVNRVELRSISKNSSVRS